jgi:hypothetical protein
MNSFLYQKNREFTGNNSRVPLYNVSRMGIDEIFQHAKTVSNIGINIGINIGNNFF